MIHQDRTTSRTRERERERERDQTHSYSAPRVNYSLLIMESTEMMKMATRERFPLRQGARMGLDWFLVATKACGGGTPDLGFFLEVWVYIRGVGVGNKSGGSPRRPRDRGRAQGGGRAPTLVVASGLFLPISGTLWDSSGPKMISMKFQVNWTLIFLFCNTQKQGKNTN